MAYQLVCDHCRSVLRDEGPYLSLAEVKPLQVVAGVAAMVPPRLSAFCDERCLRSWLSARPSVAAGVS